MLLWNIIIDKIQLSVCTLGPPLSNNLKNMAHTNKCDILYNNDKMWLKANQHTMLYIFVYLTQYKFPIYFFKSISHVTLVTTSTSFIVPNSVIPNTISLEVLLLKLCGFKYMENKLTHLCTDNLCKL